MRITRVRQRALPVFTLLLLTACSGDDGFTITGSSGDGEYSFETFFAEGQRFENFRHMDLFSPVKTIAAAQQPLQLRRQNAMPTFRAEYLGDELTLHEFLVETKSSGFLALKDGVIVSERYYQGNNPSSAHTGFSLTKSFLSALTGIALEEGHITSLDDPIRNYLPELTSGTFDDVTIRNVLQMASGVKFDEDYTDPDSDINRMSMIVQSTPYIEYINTLGRWVEPGTLLAYASINTQLLGILVARATGEPLADYLKKKIWDPVGMEFPATWTIDAQGEEQGMGGLSVSLRDYGRFGWLYANDGVINGGQILPEGWVSESTFPSEPYLQPGANEWTQLGYQYQWWVPNDPEGDFLGIGIWGQYLYVNPKRKVVLVKLSADDGTFRPKRENHQIAYLRAYARSL